MTASGTGPRLQEQPRVQALQGRDGGGHMALRPHRERPAGGNLWVGERDGGRPEAPGGGNLARSAARKAYAAMNKLPW